MKKKISILFAILAFSFTAVYTQSALKITLETEKSKFQLGEPIVVYVTLTNISSQPIEVFSEVRPEIDVYRYFITDPAGNETPFSPIYIEEPLGLTTLNQNESVHGTARIFFGSMGYVFPVAGNYKVNTRYQGASSNTLAISVVQPRNAVEEEQARLVLDHTELGFYLMIDGSDALDDANTQIDLLLEKYPNSIITAYFLYARGKSLSVPKRNFMTKKPREADLPKSVEILNSIKNSKMQLFYRNEVFQTLSANYLKMDQKEEARDVLLEFQQQLNIKRGIDRQFSNKVDMEIEKIR